MDFFKKLLERFGLHTDGPHFAVGATAAVMLLVLSALTLQSGGVGEVLSRAGVTPGNLTACFGWSWGDCASSYYLSFEPVGGATTITQGQSVTFIASSQGYDYDAIYPQGTPYPGVPGNTTPNGEAFVLNTDYNFTNKTTSHFGASVTYTPTATRTYCLSGANEVNYGFIGTICLTITVSAGGGGGSPPVAPTTGYNCSTDGTSVLVSWSSSAGSTYYIPNIGSFPSAAYCNGGWTYSSGTCSQSGGLGALNFTQSITPSTQYAAWTYACNANGCSGPSNTSIFTCNAPGATPVVSVSSSGTPSETGPTTGTYTISRTGATTASQTVGFNAMTGSAVRCTASSMGSCAVSSTDYYLTGGTCTLLGGSAINLTIPAGYASCTVTLTPIVTTGTESAETAIMTLNTSGGGYTLGTSATTLTIAADGGGGGNTVSITKSGNPSEAGPTTGTYTISRTGSTASSLNVSFTRGGTATYSSDYTLSSASSVTIPSGQTSANVTLTPVDDATNEGSETATLTIQAPSGYTTSGTNPASHTIADNDAVSGFDYELSVVNQTATRGTTHDVVVSARRTTGTGTVAAWVETGLPSGVTASYPAPTSCTPSTSFNSCYIMRLTIASNAPLGTDSITAYANGTGSITRSDTFNLTIQDTVSSFEFSLSANDIAINQGSTAQNLLAATLTSGSADEIGGFFTDGQPDGVGIEFLDGSCVPTDSHCSRMEITVDPSVPDNVYSIVVYATGPGGVPYAYNSFDLTVGGGAPEGLTVSVYTLQNAREPGADRDDNGIFELSRIADPDGNENSLKVDYVITGSASLGEDYELSEDESTCGNVTEESAVIPAEEPSCRIVIVPINNLLPDGTRTIVITPTAREDEGEGGH